MGATVVLEETLIDNRPVLSATMHVSVEQIDVTSGLPATEADLDWTFVDAEGHFHAYDADGNLPTLVQPKRKYRCVICRQRIRPGFRIVPADMFRRYAPGRREITLQIVATSQPADVVSVVTPVGFGTGTVHGHGMRDGAFEFEVIVGTWGARKAVTA